MTIDINELRLDAKDANGWLMPMEISGSEIIELLDRLELTESREAVYKKAYEISKHTVRTLTEKVIPNIRAEIDRLKVENATYIKTLLEIADWDGVWGPFPETNERWRGMAVVRAREATKSFKHGEN